EADGGLGGSAVDVMLVMQALGRALPLEPLLSTAVLGAAVLRVATPAQRARWVPVIAAGERVLAWAHDEAPRRGGLAAVACRAKREGDGWMLDGRKPAVLHGDSADALLLSARLDGGGLALFVVDAHTAGIAREGWLTHDGRRAADVALRSVYVSGDASIGSAGEAAP